MYKVGELVISDDEHLWEIVELPGNSRSFPEDYKVKHTKDGTCGLAHPDELKPVTKLHKILS